MSSHEVRPDEITLEEETKKGILVILLALIHKLGQPIDDDTVWDVLTEMQLEAVNCKNKMDLINFLRKAYCRRSYLKEQMLIAENQATVFYSWGRRAEEEFDKEWLTTFIESIAGEVSEEEALQAE